MRRSPQPTAEPASPAPARQVPSPQRLAPDPAVQREPVPASVGVPPRDAVRLTIVLQNLPTGLAAETAGVALFATDTGAEFQWLPLSACRDGAVLETTSSVLGSLTVTLATAREHARHAYLASTSQTFGRPHHDGATVQLDGAGQRVQFRVANPTHSAGPLQLQRVDDPSWQASAVAPTGLQCRGAAATEVLLGAGQYELVDPIDPTTRQRFTVPSPEPVRIREALSRPATGRP